MEETTIIPEDLIGDFIDKRCPKCNAQLLANKVGDEWCSYVECGFGLEDSFLYDDTRTPEAL